jgi:hypothetical protein
MVRRLGMPALGLGPVRDYDYVVARGRLTLPAVRQVEQVASVGTAAHRIRQVELDR